MKTTAACHPSASHIIYIHTYIHTVIMVNSNFCTLTYMYVCICVYFLVHQLDWCMQLITLVGTDN